MRKVKKTVRKTAKQYYNMLQHTVYIQSGCIACHLTVNGSTVHRKIITFVEQLAGRVLPAPNLCVMTATASMEPVSAQDSAGIFHKESECSRRITCSTINYLCTSLSNQACSNSQKPYESVAILLLRCKIGYHGRSCEQCILLPGI